MVTNVTGLSEVCLLVSLLYVGYFGKDMGLIPPEWSQERFGPRKGRSDERKHRVLEIANLYCFASNSLLIAFQKK